MICTNTNIDKLVIGGKYKWTDNICTTWHIVQMSKDTLLFLIEKEWVLELEKIPVKSLESRGNIYIGSDSLSMD